MWSDGKKFDGDIDAKGLPAGDGTLEEKNGTKYVGPFKNGMKEGKMGKETTKEGTTYEGGWSKDMKHGKGKTQTKGG